MVLTIVVPTESCKARVRSCCCWPSGLERVSAEHRVLPGRPAGGAPRAGWACSPQEQEAWLLGRHGRRPGTEPGWGLALERQLGTQAGRWQKAAPLVWVECHRRQEPALAWLLTSEVCTGHGHSGPTSESQPAWWRGGVPSLQGQQGPRLSDPVKPPKQQPPNTAAEMAHLGCQPFWGSPTATCSGLRLHSAHCPRQRDKTSEAM